MAKITLHQGDKSFTIITHEHSRFWLPCLGEDGQLYCLFDRIADGLGIIRDDMDFLDKEQRLCIHLQYKVMHHEEPKESQQIPNWDKEIFDRVEGLCEYIEEWKKKCNKEWTNE